ncbi:MAG: hypothetical protein J0H69_17355 [Burkholderiales bacterium]|nr:hypothetical protein [Burkholderiales bacterium]
MDDVFQFRNQLVDRYSNFSRSFVRIAADDIQKEVERQYQDGRYWPEPLVQINPNYQRKGTVATQFSAALDEPFSSWLLDLASNALREALPPTQGYS